MHEYRKKPVVIEAFQMTLQHRWNNTSWPYWLCVAWNHGPGEGGLWPDPDTPPSCGKKSSDTLVCGTLEGVHIVTPGDWIIRGIKGELYPIKDEIFRLTYEPVGAGEI